MIFSPPPPTAPPLYRKASGGGDDVGVSSGTRIYDVNQQEPKWARDENRT
jgi:hypothetical protein